MKMSQGSVYRATSHLLMIITASLLLTGISFTNATSAALPYCADVFGNGVQTFNRNSYVHFAYNAQIVNPTSSLITTGSIETHPFSIRKSCSAEDCVATQTSITKPQDRRRLTTTATTQIIIPRDKKITLGATGVTEFGEIRVSEWATGVFSSSNNSYIIDQLSLGYKSSLRLPAGEYWVRNLQMDVESRIDVMGEGTVNLYVINPLVVPLNVKINTNTKNPAQMTIYTYDSAEFNVGSQTYAFVRTNNELFLHHRARITGGVAAHLVDMGTESQIVYHEQGAQMLDFTNICQSSGITPPVDVTPPEIVSTFIDEDPSSNRATFIAVIRDTGDNASGIASVVLRSDTEEWPMEVNGDTYTLDVTLVTGENVFTVVARDNAGNESSQFDLSLFWSEPEFVNMTYLDYTYEPTLQVSGEIHTYWPLEDLTFTIAHEPVPLIPVEEGIYRFETTLDLDEGVNRFYINITTPIHDLEYRLDTFYEQPGLDPEK